MANGKWQMANGKWQMANMQVKGEEETYIWLIITGSGKQSNKMKVINNHTEECAATAQYLQSYNKKVQPSVKNQQSTKGT